MVPCILFEIGGGRKGFYKAPSSGIISVISGGQVGYSDVVQNSMALFWKSSFYTWGILKYFKVLYKVMS